MKKDYVREEIMVKQQACLVKVGGVRDTLLRVIHRSKYLIHACMKKIYRDLKTNYWWSGMKREIEKYVAKCVTCALVKTNLSVTI